MIELKLKERKNELQYIPHLYNQESPHDYVMYAFWALQVADVWTTNRGMDYSCVYEMNPLLPKVPHFDRLVIHKVVFLHPFYILDNEDLLTNDDMKWPLVFSLYVVHNNLKVIKRAKHRCNKR